MREYDVRRIGPADAGFEDGEKEHQKKEKTAGGTSKLENQGKRVSLKAFKMKHSSALALVLEP